MSRRSTPPRRDIAPSRPEARRTSSAPSGTDAGASSPASGTATQPASIDRADVLRPLRIEDARLLLLRVRLRELRAELSAARSGVRLCAAGLVCALSVGALWLVGHLGFRLGAAPMLGVPELEDASGGLAAGVRILVNAPMEVFRAGLDDPTRLVVGFFALALPATLLTLTVLLGAAAEGAPPRALRPLGNAMAAVAMVMAGLTILWVAAPFRGARLTAMPADVVGAGPWLAGRSTVAGLDALAATASVLWAILLLRLDIARWLRRLAGTFAIGAAAVMLVAAAISNGAAAELERPRAAIRAGADADEAALLGEAMGGPALLRRVGDTNVIELQAMLRGTALGRTTVREMLTRRQDATPDRR